MSMSDLGNGTDWAAVTAKALSYLCLHVAQLGDKDQGTQARFYLKLGMGRTDLAQMLGITPHQLRAALQQRRIRPKGKRAKGQTKSR